MKEPYTTNHTSLAAYLILSGYSLLEITYQPKNNGRLQGTFVFEDTDELHKDVTRFETSQATINLAAFEKMKSSLVDKVMARLER